MQRYRRRVIGICGFVVLAAVTVRAEAAIIVVPDDQPTIQAAVDAATANDTIQIRPGTYAESVRIPEEKSGLTAEGLGGTPLVTPPAGKEGFRIDGAAGVTISGVAVSGGTIGVRIDESDGSSVVGVTVSGATKEGIRVKRGSMATIQDDDVSGVSGGRGIRVERAPGSMVLANTVTGSAREGIRVKVSDGAVIASNVVNGSGGDGIRLHKSANASVLSNDVDTSAGRGIRITVSADLTVRMNDADGSTRSGLYVDRCEVVTISDNHADGNGEYGIRVKKSPPIASAADLMAAGNTASGNTRGDFLVVP